MARNRLVNLLLSLGLLMGISCPAASTGSYFQLGINAADFSYRETNDQGTELNREDAMLPGLAIRHVSQRDQFATVLQLQINNGIANYDGETQGGDPLTTKTDESIIAVEASIHTPVNLNLLAREQAFAGIGHRYWSRSIRRTTMTSELDERYRWAYWFLGASADLVVAHGWSSGIDVRLLYPLNPIIEVDISGFDTVSLQMGARPGYRIALPFFFRDDTANTWSVEPYWEMWSFDKSGEKSLKAVGVPTGLMAHEPANETSTIGIGISYRLSY